MGGASEGRGVFVCPLSSDINKLSESQTAALREVFLSRTLTCSGAFSLLLLKGLNTGRSLRTFHRPETKRR